MSDDRNMWGNAQEDFTIPGSVVASVTSERISYLHFVGPLGGPFTGSSTTVVLRNRTTSSADWQISANVPWMQIQTASGTLNALAQTEVAFAVDASCTQARILGDYPALITVRDVTSGLQQTIAATLSVVRNYQVEQIPYTWLTPTRIDLQGTMEDDARYGPYSYNGINWRYYDVPQRYFMIGSNGMLSLSSNGLGLQAWENTALPDPSQPNGMICGLWDDLYPQSQTALFTLGLVGTDPNRKLVATWNNVPHVNDMTKGMTFQIVCHEESNDIVINYQNLQPTSATNGNARTATIGVEHSSGIFGTTYSFNGSKTIPNRTSIRFFLPPVVLPAFTRQPADVWVYRDTPATLSVETTGDPVPNLQWQVSNDAGLTWTDISGATSAAYTTAPVPLSQSGIRYRVTALNAAGFIISNVAQVRVGTIPPPWTFADIGTVTTAGTSSCEPTSFGGFRFTLTGSGSGFWGTTDSCHALTQRIDGNATVIVKVVSQSNTDPWATAGLTMRESLEAGSPQAGVFLTGSNGAAFFRRSVLNQATAYTAGRRSAVAPRWLKLERNGAMITASESPDGVTWTSIGVTTWPSMGNTLYLGIGVASKNMQTTSTAVFEGLQVIPGGAG